MTDFIKKIENTYCFPSEHIFCPLFSAATAFLFCFSVLTSTLQTSSSLRIFRFPQASSRLHFKFLISSPIKFPNTDEKADQSTWSFPPLLKRTKKVQTALHVRAIKNKMTKQRKSFQSSDIVEEHERLG